jgi:hypothetical protein
MNMYMTYTEVQSVIGERLRGSRRERVKLNLGSGRRLRELAQHVLSLIF